MRDSFLSAGKFRYARQALILCVLAIIAYAWHDPGLVANGGSWLGYTLGVVAFLLMLRLMWFGMTKRRYRRGGQPLRYSLSAHVYLGLALWLLATLHCGFQFGFNLHTLAYALMVLVIVSGMYGVYAYVRYPRLLTDNLDNQSRETLLKQVEQLDQACVRVAEEIGSGAASSITRLIGSTAIGGTVREQLSARIKRAGVPKEINELFDKIKAAERREQMNAIGTVNLGQALLAEAGRQKSGQMHKLVDLLAQRKQLIDRIERDIRYRARLDIWLYAHVPLAFAAITAVVVHIVSVFYYW